MKALFIAGYLATNAASHGTIRNINKEFYESVNDTGDIQWEELKLEGAQDLLHDIPEHCPVDPVDPSHSLGVFDHMVLHSNVMVLPLLR